MYRKHSLIWLFGLLASIALSSSSVLAQQAERKKVDEPVVNKTKSVRIVGLYRQLSEVGATNYVLVMQNAGPIGITSYSISYKSGARVTRA